MVRSSVIGLPEEGVKRDIDSDGGGDRGRDGRGTKGGIERRIKREGQKKGLREDKGRD
jgi:hypothetical protein